MPVIRKLTILLVCDVLALLALVSSVQWLRASPQSYAVIIGVGCVLPLTTIAVFTASKYTLVPSSQMWENGTWEFPALITVKEVRDDDLLRTRNIAVGGIQSKIDTSEGVFASVVPAGVLRYKLPAIFLDSPANPGTKAIAYVPGLVNLQVWGNNLWMPKPYGPRVGMVDQFESSADIGLQIGLRATHYIDDWWTYHRLDGEVHCGTNVLRDPPSTPDDYTKWWESISP